MKYNHLWTFFVWISKKANISLTWFGSTMGIVSHSNRWTVYLAATRYMNILLKFNDESDGWYVMTFIMASFTKGEQFMNEMYCVLVSYFLSFNFFINDWQTEPETQSASKITIILQYYCWLFFITNFGINFVLYCMSGQNFR